MQKRENLFKKQFKSLFVLFKNNKIKNNNNKKFDFKKKMVLDLNKVLSNVLSYMVYICFGLIAGALIYNYGECYVDKGVEYRNNMKIAVECDRGNNEMIFAMSCVEAKRKTASYPIFSAFGCLYSNIGFNISYVFHMLVNSYAFLFLFIVVLSILVLKIHIMFTNYKEKNNLKKMNKQQWVPNDVSVIELNEDNMFKTQNYFLDNKKD